MSKRATHEQNDQPVSNSNWGSNCKYPSVNLFDSPNVSGHFQPRAIIMALIPTDEAVAYTAAIVLNHTRARKEDEHEQRIENILRDVWVRPG